MSRIDSFAVGAHPAVTIRPAAQPDAVLIALHKLHAFRIADAIAVKDAAANAKAVFTGESLATMLDLLGKATTVNPATANAEPDAGTACLRCGLKFTSRTQLFLHIRRTGHGTITKCTHLSLARAILKSDFRAAHTILTGVGAKAAAHAELDSGESMLLLATIRYVLVADEDDVVLDEWMQVIKQLIAHGCDPQQRPVQQQYLHKEALDQQPCCISRKVRGGHHGAARFVGEHLAFWSSGDKGRAFFRGSPAELVDVKYPALAVLFGAPATDRPPVLPELFEQWCDSCPTGAVCNADDGLEGSNIASCDVCMMVDICRSCHLPWSQHTHNHRQILCEEAIMGPFLPSRRNNGYTLDRNFQTVEAIVRVGRIVSNAPPSMVATLKVILADDNVPARIAKSQALADNSVRRAAIAILKEHWPSMVKSCIICDESFHEHPPTVPCANGRLRVAKQICAHTFCRGCLQRWIVSTIQDGRHKVQCPGDGCSATLYADDIERVAPGQPYADYLILIKTDYRVRLLDVLKQKLGLEKEAQTRPCPSCRCILHRISGCDDFICSCGHRFHFTRATWPSIVELEAEMMTFSKPPEVAASA
jgi:hypothetical protein